MKVRALQIGWQQLDKREPSAGGIRPGCVLEGRQKLGGERKEASAETALSLNAEAPRERRVELSAGTQRALSFQGNAG